MRYLPCVLYLTVPLLLIQGCGNESGRRDLPLSPAIGDPPLGVPNECPTASSLSVTVSEGSTVNFQLMGSDPDSTALQFMIVQGPAHGTVVVQVQTGFATYTPSAGYCGPDSFIFKVSDGTCESPVATVSITVEGCNCPVATDLSLDVGQDATILFQLPATDADGDALQYQIVQAPAHGTVVVQAQTGAASYTPAAGYCGPDSFTFIASDGTCPSNVATVTLTVCTADSDLDGVPDDEDACPDSDLRESVHVGDCDTGVPNLLGGEAVNSEGCSLADLVHGILVDSADDAPNHGQFVQEVARSVNRLARTGVITPGQQGAVLRCVAVTDEADYQP